MNIYIVGPLFTEAEEKQRLYEGNALREALKCAKFEYEINNPIEFPTNNSSSTSVDIASADYERLSDADVVFFDLANEDSGSCVALGLIIEKIRCGKKIDVYPVIHDIRLSRNGMSGYESTVGFNSMVIGILKMNDIEIYNSFEIALKKFKEKYELN